MKKINFKEDILPHLIVIGTFLILVAIYFSPAFFENQQIKQMDILQAHGGAHEISEFREKTGEEALWTNSMFSGMPAYLISTDFGGEFVKNFVNKLQYFFPHPSGLVLIHFICFYVLLLSYGVRPLYAAIGAIGFGLASFTFISIGAGHNNKVKAMGYAPLLLAGVNYVFGRKYLVGFFVTALGVALQIGSNHYQITYYLLLILFIYGLVQVIFALKEKAIGELTKQVGVLVIAGLIGLGANAGSFLTTLEYTKYSQRGAPELSAQGSNEKPKDAGLDKEYAFSYNYGIFETLSLLVPNVQGGATTGSLTEKSAVYQLVKSNYPQVDANQLIQNLPLYWGEQPMTAGPTYFGAIMIFLFVLGMLILENKTRYWLLAVTVLSIFLAWGKNFETFNYLLFDYLPGYNRFRSVTMTLIMANLTVCLGALLALHKIFQIGFNKEVQKKLVIATGITGGVCLLLILFAGSFSFKGAYDERYFGQAPELIDALKEDRASMLRSDSFRSFFLIIVAAGLIWAALKGKLSKQISLIVIGVLVLGDMWFVAKRYLNNDDFEKRAVENYFVETPADQAILQDKSLNYRVLNLNDPFNEARTSFYHKSIGGYSAAKMKRYSDLIEHQLTGDINSLIENVKKQSFDFSGLNGLNMLNTKYVMASTEANGVIKNDFALGNAWFVNGIKKVNTANEEIAAVKSINPKETAVVDVSKFKVDAENYAADASASVNLTSYSPKELKYESNNSAKGFAVFSEIYYPEGWVAFIDGKETQILRANYILRALEIPAGRHTIEFRFTPKSYSIGNTVASVSSVILLLAVGATVFLSFRAKDEKTTAS